MARPRSPEVREVSGVCRHHGPVLFRVHSAGRGRGACRRCPACGAERARAWYAAQGASRGD